MKSFFLGAILIAVGVINTVSAIEALDKDMYKSYETECANTPVYKCDAAEHCMVDESKPTTFWFAFGILKIHVDYENDSDGLARPVKRCTIDHTKYTDSSVADEMSKVINADDSLLGTV